MNRPYTNNVALVCPGLKVDNTNMIEIPVSHPGGTDKHLKATVSEICVCFIFVYDVTLYHKSCSCLGGLLCSGIHDNFHRICHGHRNEGID